MPVPSESDVAETRTRTVFEKVRETVAAGGMENYIRILEKETEDELSTVEIAAALLKMLMEHGGEEEPDRRAAATVEFGDTGAEVGMVRFFLGVGRIHKVQPKDIVGAIAGETGIPGKAIGAIRILDSYSFVEVPKENAAEVYSIMKERTIRNQPTGIEPASGKRS
jgi:ATP-dependent RNA helicase DeaD